MQRFGQLGVAITKKFRPNGAKTTASSASILLDTEDSILPWRLAENLHETKTKQWDCVTSNFCIQLKFIFETLNIPVTIYFPETTGDPFIVIVGVSSL